jgi:alkylation response protein AidB-like acyl-CoA dehydrogenase
MRDALFEYCRTHSLDGRPMTEDPDVRDLLMDLFIETEITRLFGLRNFYLAYAKKARTYEGPQYSAHRKAANLHLTRTVQQLLGYAALVTDPAYVAGEGHIEFMQRAGIVGTHPGGTIEVQKLIMSRRIGIGSTPREKAGDLG